MNVYDFVVKDKYGNDVSLERYRGKTLLIINSATTCFFTPQYKALEALYEEMKDRDFEILDFPCNQFGNQSCEPLSEEACNCRAQYNITFEQFGLVDVNGENADPLFKYLEENTKFQGFGICGGAFRCNMAYQAVKKEIQDKTSDVRWNFTKFLIDKNGEVVARFEPPEPVEIVRSEVNRLLNGEELSKRKRFSRKSKDSTSSAGQRMHTRRIKMAFLYFILAYIITLIFDLIILQKNGISIFRDGLIPGMPRISEETVDAVDHLVQNGNNIIMGYIFTDEMMVRKQLLLPIPSSILLTFALEMIMRRNEKRINKLCNALEQASTGNFAYRLKTNENDLFYRPFNDFNVMSYELNQSVKQMENAVREAEAANQSKSNFLSNMSHEIRTPLNAVLGMDEMILRESDDETILKYAADIKNAGRTLLSLINDILDFSKIEANKLDIIPVEYDLSSVVNDLVNMSTPKAQDKGLTIEFSVDESMPHILFGDEIRVKQVCTNIITNAIKYTESGKIEVFFEKAMLQDENAIRFICKDTGQGISEEDISKLTEPFARINEKKNRTIEGTGLGMSITTSLLEQMGCALEVESELGVGSTFSFTISQPAKSDEPIGNFAESYTKLLGEQNHYVETFHAPNANILVVDDVEMNLTVAKGFLKKTLVNIDTCTSGREALEIIQKKRFDLIFVDHMMPDMDGIETLNAIRNGDSINANIPVIVLTANAVSGAREKYLNAGFTDYLTKPIDSKKLEFLIIKYLPEEMIEKVLADCELDDDQMDNPFIEAIGKIPGVRTDEGIGNSGGLEAYLSVAENFANTARSRAAMIKDYWQNEDIKNYTIQVHALKSSARLVGHNGLSELAKELEASGNVGNIADINEKTEQLLADYIDLADSLSDVFKKDDNLPEIEADMLKDAITCLYEALTVFDMDMADSIMETLNNYSMPSDFSSVYNEIKVLMGNVDRDAIMSLIDNNKNYWR